MGYRRALVTRWTRRDRLAVLVVALSVAFLVGTTLVVLGAGAQTSAIAAAFGSPGQVTDHESAAAARAAAGDGVVLPYAEVTGPDGTETLAVARPVGSPLAAELGLGGQGVTLGTLDTPENHRLEGSLAETNAAVQPRSAETVLPPRWYLAPPATVEALGTDGAIAVRPSSTPREDGTPLRAALAFFRLGTRQALAALSVAALGAGVLVGVTVFGVTRMGVRERHGTIRAVRATGATPRTVLAVFALRAALLTAVGAGLGYALGVILPNAAVSAAIASGSVVSLPLVVSPLTVTVLLPVVVGPVAVGAGAGAIAAYPAATRPPAHVDDAHAPARPTAQPDRRRARLRRLRPRLLDRRLVVPTAATLAAFVVFATVAAGLGAALAPVAAPDATTIVEPGAPHPLASQVPAVYADALADRGIDASGEILLLEVVDGRPFVAVGAAFDRFAAVHGAELVAGRSPTGPAEAAVGSSLAADLDLEVGDRLVLGGSTREGLTLVTVVGRFDASGAAAGQLVVPLETARHLAGVPPGAVHLVSADRLPPAPGPDASTVGVLDVAVPDRAAANGTATVAVTLRNEGLAPSSYTIDVEHPSGVVTRTVDLDGLEARTVTVTVPVGAPGEATVRVGPETRRLAVVDPSALAIVGLPDASPLDGRPRVRVETLAGEPVANATVVVGDGRFRTDSAGRTRLAFENAGERRVVATAGDRRVVRTVDVAPGVERRLAVSLAVEPSTPSVLVRPMARVTLANPWAVPLARELVLDGPGVAHREPVSVEPGGATTIGVPLDRQAPGTYRLELTADAEPVAQTTYTVTGDDRLAAALASSGRTGASGLSRAVEAALGNLRLVLAVVLGLAALMTVGATTATFAAGVQARARTLGVHRATGAGPAAVLSLVLADAVRLGLVAAALGLVVGLGAVAGFAELGVLTVLGVRLPPVPSSPVLAGIAVVALGLTVLGAGLAGWGVLRVTPAALLAGSGSAEPAPEARDD